MSPWVRIDENAIDHPKFLALSDGAWRLWCEGQAYCQKHLTNGLINSAALKRFRYYSAARVKNLTATLVEGRGPCWHQLESGDINVHDYLDWNDSASEVLKARSDARERKRRYHDRNAVPNGVQNASETANVSSGGGNSFSGSLEEKGVRDLKTRASAFADWYAETHERLFHVGYMGTNADWMKTLELCKKFSESDLRDAALVWFGHDDDFAMNGTRTIAKFASRVSGCLQTIRAKGIA